MADSAVTTEDLPLLDKRPASPDLKKVRVGDEGTEYSLGGVIMIFLFPAMGGFLFGKSVGQTPFCAVKVCFMLADFIWVHVQGTTSGPRP